MQRGDRFVQGLVERHDIVPFVSITVQPTISTETLCASHFQILADLNDYLNLTLLQKVYPPLEPPDLSSLYGMHKRTYHLLCYITKKVQKLYEKGREERVKLLASVIQYLCGVVPSDDKIVAVVLKEELQRYCESEPATATRLRAHFGFRARLIGNIVAALRDEEMVKIELAQVITDVARSVDPKTSFFPVHGRQTEFERLFMLLFADEFDGLVMAFAGDSQQFLNDLFRVVLSCLTTLGINKRPNDAALVLLLVRFIFDRLYDTNEYFKDDGEDIVWELRGTTMDVLKLSEGFYPECDGSATVSDVFRADPWFLKAIEALEQAIFHTNPFDVLDCVEKCLTRIEAGASHYDTTETSVFPFEVMFGLFLAVVLSSQIRNWARIAMFVEAYTPLSGLCPAFDFSRTKVVASLLHLRGMVETLENEETTGE